MPLEATLLLLDNSSYMLNGDYAPTRFKAQSDAINVVFQTKTDANPENTVGVMTMGGKGPQVLVTGTKSQGQILSALHQAEQTLSGYIDIPTSISIAQLALKHRENKNLRQRIIVFVGSPPGEGSTSGDDFEKTMAKLGKKLKKNNVAVDVVCYGDGIEELPELMAGESEDGSKPPTTTLRVFVENANSGDNSHILFHPPSPNLLLSDALISSPILAGDRAAGIPDALNPDAPAAPAGGQGGGFEFGVDPSLDPELAMALRMSMQEAEAREAAEAAAAPSGATSSGTSVPTAEAESIPADPTDDDEDALLQKALAMSTADVDMDQDGEDDTDADVEMDDEEEEDDEEAAIARAIEMSMMDQHKGEKDKKDANK